MVRGKCVKSGEVIEGYYAINEDVVTISRSLDKGGLKLVLIASEVEPDTVEPVAMQVQVSGNRDSCPNCGVDFRSDMYMEAFCKYCGQCLSWENIERGGD
jgi:hypothetical protein